MLFRSELCTCALPTIENQSLENVSSSVTIDDYLVTITIVKKPKGLLGKRSWAEEESRSIMPKIQEKSYVSSMRVQGQSPTYDMDASIYNMFGHNC